MPRIILDTDVASHLYRDRLSPAMFRQLVGSELALTYVSVGEMTKWGLRRNWAPGRRAHLQSWMGQFPVVAAGREVGRAWGELIAASDARGRPRPVNDSWIAACCLAYDIPLATFNVKDYDDLTEHQGLVLVTE